VCTFAFDAEKFRSQVSPVTHLIGRWVECRVACVLKGGYSPAAEEGGAGGKSGKASSKSSKNQQRIVPVLLRAWVDVD
jgi:hypothetical protein